LLPVRVKRLPLDGVLDGGEVVLGQLPLVVDVPDVPVLQLLPLEAGERPLLGGQLLPPVLNLGLELF
jgi:hypothetical protein